MGRISARISAAIATITCPGCGEGITPREERCPKCDFPLSRYALRLKWFRVFFVGVLILVVSGGVTFLAMLSDLRGWVGWMLAGVAGVGFVTFGVGLVGIVFGGPHAPGARSSSDWQPPPSSPLA